MLKCELEALKATSQIKNESIVKLYDIVVAENHCHIAMELLEGGTLKDYLSQCKKIDEDKSILILGRILEGYRILKNNRIVHRDLKPDNIIFTADPQQEHSTPKIIDLGYCEIDTVTSKPQMFYNVGSPRYMSPEAYTSNQYS